MPIELLPGCVSLNLDQEPSRRLVFSNEGLKAVTLEILPKGKDVPWIQFELPRERRLEPGKKDSMKVWIEQKDLPKSLQVERLVYQCRIDKNPRQILEFEVEVTGPPRPELRPGLLDFGHVVAGRPVPQELKITNKGGSLLVLQRVEVAGAPELQVGPKFKTPLSIEVDRAISLPLVWHPAGEESENQEPLAREGEIRLYFGHSAAPVLVHARATRQRLLLHIEPSEVRMEQALPKYDEVVKIRLENRGTVAITLTAPKPGADWIEIDAPAPVFRLASPHSHPELPAVGKEDPQPVGTSCEIRVRLSPRKAGGPGYYRSEIRLFTFGDGVEVLSTIPVALNVLSPRPFRGSVGIDFGTTNSVVALQDLDTGNISLVADRSLGEDTIAADEHPHLIPSVLVFDKGGSEVSQEPPTYSIGRRAHREAPVSPGRTVRSIKRLVGSGAEFTLSGRIYKPEEVAALILRRLVEYAERQILALRGEAYEINKAVVTVPSAFFDAQIQAIEAACRNAGILIEGAASNPVASSSSPALILYEPAAAALFFVHQLKSLGPELVKKVNRPRGLNLLIYDHGGGTLDLALARVRASRESHDLWTIQILANIGSAAVGGDTLDILFTEEMLGQLRRRQEFQWLDPQLILSPHSKLLARAQREHWNLEDLERVLYARFLWKTQAEVSKIKLSDQEGSDRDQGNEGKVDVDIPREAIVGFDQKRRLHAFPGESPRLTVTPKEYELMLGQQLDFCAALVTRTIRIARLKPEQVDYLIHTGRQSHMPAIRRRIREIFPQPVRPEHDWLDPAHLKVCVSLGASLFGRLRSGGSDGIVLSNAGRVLPFTYGRRVIRDGIFELFEPLVPIGTAYPTSEPIVRTIPEKKIRSPRLQLDLWQNSGESKEFPSPELRHLSNVELGLPEVREGGISLRLEVDAHRRLVISTDVDSVVVEAEALEENRDEWIG